MKDAIKNQKSIFLSISSFFISIYGIISAIGINSESNIAAPALIHLMYLLVLILGFYSFFKNILWCVYKPERTERNALIVWVLTEWFLVVANIWCLFYNIFPLIIINYLGIALLSFFIISDNYKIEQLKREGYGRSNKRKDS